MSDDTAPRREPARTHPALRLESLPQIRRWIIVPGMLGAAVLALGFSARFIPGYAGAELAVDQDLSRHHDGVLNAAAMALSGIFSPVGGSVLLALACLFLLVVRRAPVNALAFGSVASVGWLSAQLVKVVVERPRPNPALLADPLAPETGFDSFPSGHVSLAVGLAFAIWFLARGTRWERFSMLFGALMVVGLALSRLYVGVHYPTDVLAAMLSASAAVLFFCGLWNRYAMALVSRLGFLRPFGPLPQRPPAAGPLPRSGT